MTNATSLPPIFIGVHDFERLQDLAGRHAERGHAVARFLGAELRRAVICPPAELPDDAVGMNCRATYRITERSRPESRFLVYPEDYTLYGGHISVLSPAGAALLGLRAGEAMPYVDSIGSRHRLVLESIDYRPSARVVPFRRRSQAPAWSGDDRGPDDAA